MIDNQTEHLALDSGMNRLLSLAIQNGYFHIANMEHVTDVTILADHR
jgi:hypothetical protein